MGGKRQYSIKELSERTGIEPRTIRWYISEGLLRGPEALGRAAYYTEHHRKRLEVIKTLRDTYGMPLAQIRKYVLMAGDEDIEVVALPFPGSDASDSLGMVPRSARFHAAREIPRLDDADERVAFRARDSELEAHRAFVSRKETGKEGGLPPVGDALGQRGPIPQLLEALRAVLKDRRIPRQARAEEVYRISVTPEITLEVAGGLTRAERALFEQLADHLREVLLGGGRTEET